MHGHYLLYDARDTELSSGWLFRKDDRKVWTLLVGTFDVGSCRYYKELSTSHHLCGSDLCIIPSCEALVWPVKTPATILGTMTNSANRSILDDHIRIVNDYSVPNVCYVARNRIFWWDIKQLRYTGYRYELCSCYLPIEEGLHQ